MIFTAWATCCFVLHSLPFLLFVFMLLLQVCDLLMV